MSQPTPPNRSDGSATDPSAPESPRALLQTAQPQGVADDTVSHQTTSLTETRSPTPPVNVEQLYENRLRELWATVHGSPPDLGQSEPWGQWTLLTEIVRSSGVLREIGRPSLAPAAPRDDEPLAGRLDEIGLRVGAMIGQMTPDELIRFVSGRLASTVERLELSGQSKVGITDVISRAIRELPDGNQVSRIATLLLGYVHQQPEISADYALSVAILGDLAGRGDPSDDEIPASLIAYHSAVRVIWELAQRDQRLEPRARDVVATNALNLTIDLWRSFGDAADQASVKRASQRLLSASAVAADVPVGSGALADDALAALGLEAVGGQVEARDLMAVLRQVSGIGGAWTDAPMDESRMEASGAVAAAVCDEPEYVAQRLFNAGVSLLRLDSRESDPNIRARLVLNLAGLRWGLAVSPTGDLMSDRDARSCAVNFAGAATQLAEARPSSAEWAALRPLVAMILALPAVHPPRSEAVMVDVARLAAASRRLDLTPRPAEGPADLMAAMNDGLALLRDQRNPPDRSNSPDGSNSPDQPDGRPRGEGASPEHHLVLETADTVRWVYEDLLGQTQWGLLDAVVELAAHRADPLGVFLEAYRPYAARLPDDLRVGTGPLVAEGLLPAEAWLERIHRLVPGPRSMAPVLRQLA